MRLLVSFLLSTTLVACKFDGIDRPNGRDPVQPPTPIAEGTVLSTSCEEYTLVEEIADGEGGSIERLTERSAECGWNPPPRGTLLNSGCSKDYPGVKWFVYADGEYGTYSEKDPRSIECGYVPLVLEATVEGNGARFKDVTITVTATNNDEPVDFEWEHTIGVATQEGNVIKIRGDGRTGTGYITLRNGELTEEYQYGIYNDEYCDMSESSGGVMVDCQGYNVSSRWNRGRSARPAGISWETGGMIYYGEPDVDTQRVVWEVVWVQRAFAEVDEERYGEEISYNDGNTMRTQMRRMQAELDRAGVHIELRLVAAVYGPVNVNYTGGWLSTARPDLYKGTDIVIGWGASEPGTCGVAYAGQYFSTGRPRVAISRCSWDTTLHEIGHAVGLAHGPENSGFPASGYIFPEFGHGRENLCDRSGTIMSYDSSKFGLSNSLQECKDGTVAGGRDLTDEAYALNRVRYNVSLIHDENLAEELQEAPTLLAAPVASPTEDYYDDEEHLILD